MEFYSDGLAEIQAMIQHITVGSTNLDTLTPQVVEQYQRETDAKINSILGELYEVPFIKVSTAGGVTTFPEEIKYVARRLVAAEIILNEFTEIAPNVSKAAVNHRERATEDIFEYVKDFAGGRRIQGQRVRARNRFMRPTIYPSKPPEAPGKLPSV